MLGRITFSFMKHATTAHRDFTNIARSAASPFVRRFASTIASAANGTPILDVACGSGRNAMIFAEMGCEVICVDIDLSRIKNELSGNGFAARLSSSLQLRTVDLIKDPWPFEERAFGGIINVDFLLPDLLPHFQYSLTSGGYILFETISGRGGNYLQLPASGEIKSALKDRFHLELYQERKVGPRESDAVTVKFLGRRVSV